MFQRFTDRARRVLVLAQNEARSLNHEFMDSDHLLLGLIAEGEGVAAKALGELGVTYSHVRDKVETFHGTEGNPTPEAPSFSPRAKKILELSLREALRLDHSYIGTEHLLLSVTDEGEHDGAAHDVLSELGVEMPAVRAQVFQMISGHRGWEPETPLPEARLDSAALYGIVREVGRQLRPDLSITDITNLAPNIADELYDQLIQRWTATDEFP